MIAGLPLTAWLLLIATIALPLAIVFAYFFNQRSERRRRREDAERRTGAGYGR